MVPVRAQDPTIDLRFQGIESAALQRRLHGRGRPQLRHSFAIFVGKEIGKGRTLRTWCGDDTLKAWKKDHGRYIDPAPKAFKIIMDTDSNSAPEASGPVVDAGSPLNLHVTSNNS
ncbi:MAG: hypothetical protein M1839_003053 [Geoglossum umbratile]|nr:MAG: hypothetical protein M1839_003053 [Geoglossum umbratile]